MADQVTPLDPQRDGVFPFARFHGLRNNVSPETFAPTDLVAALNCDIDDALNLHRRKGYSAPVTAAIDRDIYANGSVCLGVGSNALKLVNADFSTVTLRSGLSAGRPLSYAAIDGRVFYANGIELGCVQNGVDRTWGIAAPTAIPIPTATGGSMPAGNYQYAVTYIRNDAQESGTGKAGTFTLAVTGGIALSSIPVSADPTVTRKFVYCTDRNGETMYRSGIIDNSATTFVIREIRAGTSPLLTQFMNAPPAGASIIAESRGHMLAVVDNRLYVSDPFAPELFDLRRSFLFNDPITLIAPINDGKVTRQHGVFVGTDRQIIFLEGDGPSTWTFRVIANYGIIPGTLFYGDGELLGAGDAKERIAFFAAKTGLCAGKMGGDLVNLTQARFSYPAMDRGAGLVRRHRGIAQYLVTLQGTEIPGNIADVPFALFAELRMPKVAMSASA